MIASFKVSLKIRESFKCHQERMEIAFSFGPIDFASSFGVNTNHFGCPYFVSSPFLCLPLSLPLPLHLPVLPDTPREPTRRKLFSFSPQVLRAFAGFRAFR